MSFFSYPMQIISKNKQEFSRGATTALQSTEQPPTRRR